MRRKRARAGSRRVQLARLGKLAARLGEWLGALVGAALLLVGVGLFLGLGPEGMHAWPTTKRRVEILGPKSKVASEETPYGAFAALLNVSLNRRGIASERQGNSGSLTSLVQLDASEEASGDKGSKRATTPSAARIAIVQSDVAYHYVRGGHPQFVEPHESSHVRTLARLFTERLELWVPAPAEREAASIVCNGAKGNAMDDEPLLGRERLCAGGVGSGSMLTARNVGRLLGARWQDYNASESGERAPDLCAFGIAFSNSNPAALATPSEKFTRCKPAERSLCGFGVDAVAMLENSFGGKLYHRLSLPGNSDAYTITWDALLVADQDLDRSVVKVIEEVLVELSERCAHFSEANTGDAIELKMSGSVGELSQRGSVLRWILALLRVQAELRTRSTFSDMPLAHRVWSAGPTPRRRRACAPPARLHVKASRTPSRLLQPRDSTSSSRSSRTASHPRP